MEATIFRTSFVLDDSWDFDIILWEQIPHHKEAFKHLWLNLFLKHELEFFQQDPFFFFFFFLEKHQFREAELFCRTIWFASTNFWWTSGRVQKETCQCSYQLPRRWRGSRGIPKRCQLHKKCSFRCSRSSQVFTCNNFKASSHIAYPGLHKSQRWCSKDLCFMAKKGAGIQSVLSPQHLSHHCSSSTAAWETPQHQGQLGLFHIFVLFWAAGREKETRNFRLIRGWAEPASRGYKSSLEAWKKAWSHKALQQDRARPVKIVFSAFLLSTQKRRKMTALMTWASGPFRVMPQLI